MHLIHDMRLEPEGFESPFSRTLTPHNRWIVLSKLIQWDEICSQCHLQLCNIGAGRKPLSPRIVIGSLIIKFMLNFDNRETVSQISENMYMQYFLGYSSFISEEPFDASMFVDFCKELGVDTINSINEMIVRLKILMEENGKDNGNPPLGLLDSQTQYDLEEGELEEESVPNKGGVIVGTICPQILPFVQE